MEFEFSAEQQQLKDQVRRFLADRCDRDAVRAVLEGEQPFDRPLWKAMGELGYLGASIPEAYGGLGAGYLEACVIAEELGRAVAPVPFGSSIALAAEFLLMAGTEAQKQKYLPRVASGEAIGTLALVEGTGRVTPASIAASVVRAGEHHSLTGCKTAVADGDIADFAVVAARDASQVSASSPRISLFLVDLQQAGVKRSPLATIDPTRSHAQLDFDKAMAEPLGEPGAGLSIIEKVFDRAAILTAFEQLGGADRALEMARDYALERFAFGRPIGSLQAIKHMLADMYVSATLARSNCYYGAWALSTDAPELSTAAATARVSATQAYQHCSRNNIQVHGGMGFTWQFDCHLYYRRSNLLAVSLGPLSGWEDRLIKRLSEQRAA
jgi:alkylation response protein AidB-like acyl-CoA dehydrogenase